jgi:outer membrane protein assembly factor BamB
LPLADRLYVGALDNYFYCLDTKDGDVDWRWATGADLRGMPVIDSRRVYFVALDNVLRAHDRNSGTMVWKKVLPMRPSSGPVMSGNILIVAGVAMELRAYGTVDGQPAGNFALKGAQGEELTLAAPPHLSPQDLLIITTKSGQLHALTSATP